ncbi:MAG: type II toxin-antitoxin system HicA family toxin [Nanoarchaeota archaeon]
MSKMPQLTAVQLSKIVQKIGFKFIRQSGSHMFFKHDDGRSTVIPNHPGEKIGPGFLLNVSKKSVSF